MPEGDVEQLLVSLILDNRIQGHIDQVNRLLERGDRSTFISNLQCFYDAISFINPHIKWTTYHAGRRE